MCKSRTSWFITCKQLVARPGKDCAPQTASKQQANRKHPSAAICSDLLCMRAQTFAQTNSRRRPQLRSTGAICRPGVPARSELQDVGAIGSRGAVDHGLTTRKQPRCLAVTKSFFAARRARPGSTSGSLAVRAQIFAS